MEARNARKNLCCERGRSWKGRIEYCRSRSVVGLPVVGRYEYCIEAKLKRTTLLYCQKSPPTIFNIWVVKGEKKEAKYEAYQKGREFREDFNIMFSFYTMKSADIRIFICSMFSRIHESSRYSRYCSFEITRCKSARKYNIWKSV